MNTPTITPVVVGLGQAVHIADGKGTLCRPKALSVAVVEHERVTCKRCLKAVATTSATETPAPAASSKKVKGAGPATHADCGCGCGEATSGGRFRPGHDARLAGQLIRAVVAGQLAMGDALESAGSTGLRAKVTRGVERAAQKGAAA